MRRLEERDIEFLQSKPESSYRSTPLIAIALNAEFLVTDLRELVEPEEERKGLLEDFLEGRSLVDAGAVRVWVPEFALRSYRSEGSQFRGDAEMLAGGDRFPSPEPPYTGEPRYLAPRLPHRRGTGPEEGFVRYVAYPQDRRVTPDRGLLPGTYVTTVNDAKLIPSGLAAVGRYALPNPRPARYASTIVPGSNAVIDYGTVVPMFGQAGGGVEAHFASGTGPGTVSRPYEIPEG